MQESQVFLVEFILYAKTFLEMSTGAAGDTDATRLPKPLSPRCPKSQSLLSLNIRLQSVALATLGFLMIASDYSCCASPPSDRQAHRPL